MPGLFCIEGDSEVSFGRSTLEENKCKRHIFIYQVKCTVATRHTAWAKAASDFC